ncbi:MAG: glycogen-binding domain-containing protein, partial [bacterium]
LDPSAGIMTDENGDGIWELKIDLPSGRYQYKYVVDRVSWVMDPSNPDTDTEDGIENSLLILR